MRASRLRRGRLLPHKTPTQARAQVTYGSILDAAARFLGRRGYAAMTSNHLAAEAGVSVGTLYEYFPNKEAVVAQLARRTLGELLREMETGIGRMVATAEEVGLGAALRAWIGLLFEAVRRRRAFIFVLWRDVPFVKELEEVQALPGALLSLARRAQPLGTSKLLRSAPEASTFLLTTMVMNAVLDSVSGRPAHLTEAQLEETLVEMVAAIVA